MRRRAAEMDAAQPRPGEEAMAARIDELMQMVAALRGNDEEPDAANAAQPIAAPHAAEMSDLMLFETYVLISGREDTLLVRQRSQTRGLCGWQRRKTWRTP